VGNALVAGTVYTAAQPNITSVGTLSSLAVTGNVTAGNINAGNLLTTNNLSVTTFVTSSLIPNANVTYDLGNSTNRWKDLWLSNSTLYFDTNSTIAAGTVTNGNSNLSIPVANGNVNISAVGNANIVVVTGTGVNVAGTLNTTGNTTVANLSASGVVSGIMIQTSDTVTSNTTITSGNNGMTVGPTTINTGVTVTVSTNQRWMIF
jgi:hypothetical protein